MISRYFRYILFSLLLIFTQEKILRYIGMEGITPDILTIWVVYLALRYGQMRGMLWGFCIGLVFDLSVGNFIGLSAFTKTIAGFTAGYFYDEERKPIILGSYRFVIIILIVSFIHNIFYFIISTRGSEIGFMRAVLELGVATTCYTGVVALLPMFVFTRKFAK